MVVVVVVVVVVSVVTVVVIVINKIISRSCRNYVTQGCFGFCKFLLKIMWWKWLFVINKVVELVVEILFSFKVTK